jgi:hypothetical protein
MSLGVAPELLDQAAHGEIEEAAFAAADRCLTPTR